MGNWEPAELPPCHAHTSAHLESVLEQVRIYLGSTPATLRRPANLQEWPREAYTVFNELLP